ncbi:MAG: pitrilysin family protein [Bacteroidota bacterium]|nr:pitrilysin family protein [Bacteroidota bacterium]
MTSCSRNGTDQAVLLPVEDDPTVSFRVWFKTGSQADPAGLEGISALTAAMMTEGATESHSYEDILSALYPMAASYGATVDKEMTVFSGRIHKDNLPEYYPLFINAILKPAFSEEDFTRIRTDMINGIEKSLRYADDEELGKAALYTFVYDNTPYGHLDVGTVSSLEAITLEDVRAHYRTCFTRGNVVIGLGGGYEDTLLTRLEQDLALLPEGAPVQPGAPAPLPLEGRHVLLVEKECNATAISFGFPIDVVRGDEDFWALALFNSWFGEHRNSSSHLYQVIREARGMNYGDYSYIEIFPNGGRRQMPAPNHARRQQMFEVWLRPVQHQHRHFALRAAIRELQQVIDSGMTQEDFALTQKFLDKYALHYATTTMDRLGYAIDSRFYGIDGDYVSLFREKIAGLTLEEVNAAIRRHLQSDNLRIAMVTNGAEEFATALAVDAPSPVTYETPKPEEILAEDKDIEVYPLGIAREDIRIVPVEEMFR